MKNTSFSRSRLHLLTLPQPSPAQRLCLLAVLAGAVDGSGFYFSRFVGRREYFAFVGDARIQACSIVRVKEYSHAGAGENYDERLKKKVYSHVSHPLTPPPLSDKTVALEL
jgi:hypothetical protein